MTLIIYNKSEYPSLIYHFDLSLIPTAIKVKCGKRLILLEWERIQTDNYSRDDKFIVQIVPGKENKMEIPWNVIYGERC